MNGDTPQPINILLSRDELLYVLNSLKATFILGLDSDPAGDRNDEQQALAMTIASRALRARGLAQLVENGQLTIHNALLAAVGVCSYPQQTLSVYHWPSQQTYTTRYFAHLRGNEIITHTRPEDVLHLLARLPSKRFLVEQVVRLCQCNDVQPAQPLAWQITAQQFGAARQLAEQGKTAEAVALLDQSNDSGSPLQPLVDSLAHTPHVSVVQALKRQSSGMVEKKECTVIQNSAHPWLIQPIPDQTGTLLVKATTKAEIQSLLAGWLA